MRSMPTKLRAARDWTVKLGEVDQAAALKGDALQSYAAASAELAQAFGETDVTAEHVAEFAAWERVWRANG